MAIRAMRRRTGRVLGARAGLLALVIAAPLALAACGGGTAGGASGSSAEQKSVDRAAAPNGLSANGSSGSNSSTGSGSGSGSGSAHSGAASDGTANVALSNRSMIITAGLQVKTDDAAAAAARAQQLAQTAGGFVASESIGAGNQVTPDTGGAAPQTAPSGSSSEGSGSNGSTPNPAQLPALTGASNATQALLVLRVPPAQLDPVLKALADKGSVTYQNRTQTDVTGQVADVGSRVASAQSAIAELRAMISKAASMNDLIELEQALSQRESDLESLQAQQKALADQVQYATITVGYFSQGAPAAAPSQRNGFVQGLITGWHGFTHVLRALLLTAGWLLPYAAVAAILWWPVRRLVRRSRGRTRRGPATAALATAGPSSPDTPDTPSGDS